MTQFCLKNRNFLWNCLKNRKKFGNLPGKIEFFVKLPEKATFFGNLPGKWNFFTRIHDPPDFKPDWRRCLRLQLSCIAENVITLSRVMLHYFKSCWVFLSNIALTGFYQLHTMALFLIVFIVCWIKTILYQVGLCSNLCCHNIDGILIIPSNKRRLIWFDLLV